MLCDCDGTERVDGAPASDHDREKCRGRSDFPAAPIPENLAGIDFSRHRPGHGHRNGHSARIVTIDDNCPERNGLFERLPHLGLNESWLLRKYVAIDILFAIPFFRTSSGAPETSGAQAIRATQLPYNKIR